jgi:hypothetical protein
MIKEYKERMPEWCFDDVKRFDLVLSDDIDSLSTCIVLNQLKGYEISHFYNFKSLYKVEGSGKYKLIGVDMDLIKGRSFGNHPTGVFNPLGANLNIAEGINTDNYTKKYAGSCILTVLSLYDVDISQLSTEAKMTLLAIDASFKMYAFNPLNAKRWIKDILQFYDLYELLENHSQQEFYDLIDKYKLYKKIHKNEKGTLFTDIDLEGLSNLFNVSFSMPKNSFKIIETYTDKGIPSCGYSTFCKQLKENNKEIFSQAIVKKTFIKLSYATSYF